MLALPAILIAIGSVSGGSGIALSIKSAIDSVDASAVNREAQERNNKNLQRLEACSNDLDKRLEKLGNTRMVISKNFNVFATQFEKIHNCPKFNSIEDTEFPRFDFDDIKNVSVIADQLFGSAVGAVGGTVASAVAASGMTATVVAIGTASTGTKIATLAGAAKTKAVMAALGGGAKAVSGGGIALGTIVLNSATFGVGILVEGIAMAYAGSKAKKDADKMHDQMIANEKIISDAIEMQLSVSHSADAIRKVSARLCNDVYKPLARKMGELVSKKQNWDLYTDEEKLLVDNNIRIVQILNYLNNLALYKVTKLDEKGEAEETEANDEEIKDAIKKARRSARSIGGQYEEL